MFGATPSDWARLQSLDLTEDLLPVVSDASVTIDPASSMRATGKTPSRINHAGNAAGIAAWTQQRSTHRQVHGWAQDGRLGICLQTRTVRAIDVDIADPEVSSAVRGMVEMVLGKMPCRWRGNSGKLLLAFNMPGDFSKRILSTEHGAIEFLATGQQFIAFGTHPTGARYQWDDLDIADVLGQFPEVEPEEFEVLWAGLQEAYQADGITTRLGAQPTSPRRRADATPDPVLDWLEANDKVLEYDNAGRAHVQCPWEHEHTSDTGPSATSWLMAGVGGFNEGRFSCRHAHCAHRGNDQFLEAVGFNEAQFEVVPASAQGEAPAVKRKGVPAAQHLTTDQANAGRIVHKFGKHLIVMAGQWFAWSGKRWEKDDGEVYRYACNLSKIIHGEADGWAGKKGASAEETEKHQAIAEALRKWAQKSEMKNAIEAAVGLAKKMMAVGDDALDSDPWSLNCLNGTVDLRTGELRPHTPSDYITKLVPLEYNPNASSAAWETVVGRVTLEEDMVTRPLARFLQRWFGYCATASTREQVFVVHYGQGSNGKSTILDTVAEVLGDYAATAAPGLLVGKKNEEHPTGVADIFGRRMVTSHESGEGGALKEEVVKQLTGGDKIKARFMRGDFFEFDPTHKLQLLTNHKPAIKGQDNGIWRRVLLMPYLARFAVAEEVAAGRAHYVRDTRITERIRAELQGVLTWVVKGAMAWAQDGLQPPDTVLAASRDYQTEQDRISQFLIECCEMDAAASEPLADGMGGLYQTYREWCNEGGWFPLSKQKFTDELERCVPNFAKKKAKVGSGGERRRDVLLIQGLRLLHRY